VVLRYSTAVNRKLLHGFPPYISSKKLTDQWVDYTSINLTKREHYGIRLLYTLETDSKFVVDVLDTFQTIRAAVAYVTPNGEKLKSFPADLSLVSAFLGVMLWSVNSYPSSKVARLSTLTLRAGKVLLRVLARGLISPRKHRSMSSSSRHG
jgi:hypothetical protein